MGKYQWVYWHNGQDMRRLRDVGILPDGTLHNPNGYPEDIVRTAVLAADERCRTRRSEAAKKAAATRRERRGRLVYSVAKGIVDGRKYGPRENCAVCGKGLGDSQSIARGIGSDCWQCVLEAISHSQSNNQLTLSSESARPPSAGA